MQLDCHPPLQKAVHSFSLSLYFSLLLFYFTLNIPFNTRARDSYLDELLYTSSTISYFKSAHDACGVEKRYATTVVGAVHVHITSSLFGV